VDNDCNGKADVNDGLPLTGTTQAEGNAIQGLSWSPAAQNFIVMRNGTFGTMVRTSGTAHSINWNSTPSVSKTGYAIQREQLAWMPARQMFALSYVEQERSANYLVTDINTQGTTSGGVRSVCAVSLSIAPRSSGDVIILCTDGIYRYTGAAVETTPTATNPGYGWITTSGDEGAMIGSDGNGAVIWSRFGATLSAQAASQLSTSGKDPHIASVSNGYAAAWGTTLGLDYQIMSATGQLVCGPTHVTGVNIERLAIANTQYGTLVLTTHSNWDVHLFRFDSGCRLIDDQLLPAHSGIPLIAVGGGLVALVYDSNTRIVGERLCN
jgi:hypothetical protein